MLSCARRLQRPSGPQAFDQFVVNKVRSVLARRFEVRPVAYDKPAFLPDESAFFRARDEDAIAAGVRAQAVSKQGDIIDDWIIDETDRVINVENAPSPAATASLNLGRLVVERLAPRFA